jgi:hypothetical protein
MRGVSCAVEAERDVTHQPGPDSCFVRYYVVAAAPVGKKHSVTESIER